MKTKDMLRGVWAPITTPFLSNEEVNYDGLKENMSVYAQSGIHGYLALGSNGENKSLLQDEKQKVLSTIIKYKSPAQKVMVGCIAESTIETIQMAKAVASAGADCVTLLPPSYFAKQMTDEALTRYFVDVADSVNIPVLVYCAPQFSAGTILSTSLIQEIAKHPNIVGMKDSSTGNIDKYIDIAPEDFVVMAGSANIFGHTLERGSVGGIMSLSNIFPKFCVTLYDAFMSNDKETFNKLNEKMLLLNTEISGKGGVAAVKAAMDMVGLAGGVPRLPLLPLSEEIRSDIKKLLEVEGMI